MMDEIQLTVADVMTPTTVALARCDTVAAAAELIRREHLAGLPVVEENQIVGFVAPLQLLLEPAYRPVGDVMIQGLTPATPALTLLQAHALMTRQRVEVLPVIEDGEIVGQISVTAILRSQGQQTDPLTGLPWAAALRSWASAALAHGEEITMLFIDLDDFGEVNKALGHVTGDDILCAIARLLGSLVDPATDLLCRYGGDEFTIATTRGGDSARDLARRIQHTVVLPIELGETRRPITASVGTAGGRRAEGRKRDHIAATVEDLLALASHASTAVKRAKGTGGPGPPLDEPAGTAVRPEPEGGHERNGGGEARLRLVEVLVDADQGGYAATVTLRLGTREGVGSATGSVRGRGIMFVVGEAMLVAIRRTIGERHAYVLEALVEVPGIEKLVVAVLSGEVNASGGFVGAARAPDLPHAVAKAILHALNRPLARTLAEYLGSDPSR